MCVAAHDFVTHAHVFPPRGWPRRATRLANQTTFAQRVAQQRFDLMTNRIIRISSPGKIGIEMERSTETLTALVSHDYSGFTRDQFRTDIVRMTADPKRETAPFHQRLSQRSQISHKPIMAHHQLVKLAARRQVLIFKTRRLTRLDRT